MKITKKQMKAEKSLATQRKHVHKIEDLLIKYADPVICPVKHYFTDNEKGLNICCREFFMPAGTLLTGTIYKMEMFMVMASGSLRVVEGDHTRDICAPALMKNVVGTKNSWYSFEDTTIFGFIPNPENSRNILDILNVFSAIDGRKIQGMGANEQELNYQGRLLNETVA